jgi:hypothetical protein
MRGRENYDCSEVHILSGEVSLLIGTPDLELTTRNDGSETHPVFSRDGENEWRRVIHFADDRTIL